MLYFSYLSCFFLFIPSFTALFFVPSPLLTSSIPLTDIFFLPFSYSCFSFPLFTQSFTHLFRSHFSPSPYSSLYTSHLSLFHFFLCLFLFSIPVHPSLRPFVSFFFFVSLHTCLSFLFFSISFPANAIFSPHRPSLSLVFHSFSYSLTSSSLYTLHLCFCFFPSFSFSFFSSLSTPPSTPVLHFNYFLALFFSPPPPPPLSSVNSLH